MAAMKKEYNSNVKNDTWYLTDLPRGKRQLVSSGFIS